MSGRGVGAEAGRRPAEHRTRISREGMFALLGVLLGIVAVTLPELGSDPWPFRPGSVDPQGILAPLVRAADSEWDVGIARTTCFLAALLIGAVGVVGLRRRDWPAWTGVAVTALVALALMAPSTLLQMGLRQSTEPWFFTNDSTYQIEIGGDKVLDGENPYGADYRSSGMERFYPFDGRALERVREREVALEHFAYFPGTAIAGAVVAGAAGAAGRLPAAGAAVHARRAGRGAGVPRPAGVAAGHRRGDRGQPDRRALGLVRPERRALDHADDPGLRAGHPRPRALGRGRAGGRGAAEAVRRGGHPVPGDHAAEAAGSAGASSSASALCSPP